MSGNVSNRALNIANGDVQIFLKFSTVEEFSSWLRQASDFGVTAASRQVQTQTQAPSSKTRTSDTQKTQYIEEKADNDDFSVTFGM